jgi:hypothetical protein
MFGVGGPTFSYVTAIYIIMSTIGYILDINNMTGSMAICFVGDFLQLIIVFCQISELVARPVCRDWSRRWTYVSSSIGFTHTFLYSVGHPIPRIPVPSASFSISLWATVNLLVTIWVFFGDLFNHGSEMEHKLKKRAVEAWRQEVGTHWDGLGQ